MLRKLLLLAALLFPAIPASAVCTLTSGALKLEKPTIGDSFSIWANCLQRDLEIISSSAATVNNSTSSTFNLGTIYVNRIGGMASGTANIRLSSSVYQDASLYLTTYGTAAVVGNAFSVGVSTLYVNNGTVGIGVTDPTQKLDIYGNLAGRGNQSGHGITIYANTDEWGRFSRTSASGGGTLIQGVSNSASFNGLVLDGIIGSNTPTAGLPAVKMRCAKSNGSTNIAALGATDTCFDLRDESSDTRFLTVLGSGNVGLGTTMPAQKLHLSSGTLYIDGTSNGINNFGHYSASGTAGLTTATCSAGQTLGAMSVRSGIVTAGSCAASGAGDVVTTATQTFSGVNTFLSTTTFTGSVQGTINASTRAAIPGNNTAITQTSMLAAVANSTITLVTTVGSRHQLIVSAGMRVSDAGAHSNCGVIQNGAWFDGQSSTLGIWVGHPQGSPHYIPFNTTWNTITTYPAGTYNYAIACAVNTGNITFCANNNATADAVCFFEARELK